VEENSGAPETRKSGGEHHVPANIRGSPVVTLCTKNATVDLILGPRDLIGFATIVDARQCFSTTFRAILVEQHDARQRALSSAECLSCLCAAGHSAVVKLETIERGLTEKLEMDHRDGIGTGQCSTPSDIREPASRILVRLAEWEARRTREGIAHGFGGGGVVVVLECLQRVNEYELTLPTARPSQLANRFQRCQAETQSPHRLRLSSDHALSKEHPNSSRGIWDPV